MICDHGVPTTQPCRACRCTTHHGCECREWANAMIPALRDELNEWREIAGLATSIILSNDPIRDRDRLRSALARAMEVLAEKQLAHITDADDPLACWCRPYRDIVEPEVIIHREVGRA